MIWRLISLFLLTSPTWAEPLTLPPLPPKCELLDNFSGVHPTPVANISIQQQSFFQNIATGVNLSNSYAIYLMGVYTDQGVGTLVDPYKATNYFYQAALMGDLNGQYAIAIRNLHGITLPVNILLARSWFKKITLSKPVKDADLDAIECARWHYTKIQLGPPYF